VAPIALNSIRSLPAGPGGLDASAFLKDPKAMEGVMKMMSGMDEDSLVGMLKMSQPGMDDATARKAAQSMKVRGGTGKGQVKRSKSQHACSCCWWARGDGFTCTVWDRQCTPSPPSPDIYNERSQHAPLSSPHKPFPTKPSQGLDERSLKMMMQMAGHVQSASAKLKAVYAAARARPGLVLAIALLLVALLLRWLNVL